MKHAYLIIAHDKPDELMRLLSALDYSENDIYVHLDRKSTCFSIEILKEQVCKSDLYFVPRIDVTWGGQSQIQAELSLFLRPLRMAVIGIIISFLVLIIQLSRKNTFIIILIGQMVQIISR